MKPSESAQVEFIKDLLRNGEQRKAILAKFCKKWQSVAVRTFDTRLKVATGAMDAELEQINKRTEESIGKEVEARKLKIMTVAERIDLLVKIASGEIKVKKPFVISGKIMEYPMEPDHTDRTKAIAELNKMDGSYAPNKTDLTSGGSPIKSIVIDRASNSKRK